MIFTIGYSALGYKAEMIIPELKKLIKQFDAILIDIRSNPYGLVNLPELKKALSDRYEWHGELGFPAYLTATKTDITYENVLLMCAEKNVDNCHRKDVAEKMRIWRGRNEQIEHLNSTKKRGRQTCL